MTSTNQRLVHALRAPSLRGVEIADLTDEDLARILRRRHRRANPTDFGLRTRLWHRSAARRRRPARVRSAATAGAHPAACVGAPARPDRPRSSWLYRRTTCASRRPGPSPRSGLRECRRGSRCRDHRAGALRLLSPIRRTHGSSNRPVTCRTPGRLQARVRHHPRAGLPRSRHRLEPGPGRVLVHLRRAAKACVGRRRHVPAAICCGLPIRRANPRAPPRSLSVRTRMPSSRLRFRQERRRLDGRRPNRSPTWRRRRTTRRRHAARIARTRHRNARRLATCRRDPGAARNAGAFHGGPRQGADLARSSSDARTNAYLIARGCRDAGHRGDLQGLRGGHGRRVGITTATRLHAPPSRCTGRWRPPARGPMRSGIALGHAATIDALIDPRDDQRCECAPCEAAPSPAAYLADLIGYVVHHLRVGRAVDLLQDRDAFHQPSGHLPTDCAAVEQQLRQVRICIEVLRAYLKANPLSAAQATALQLAEAGYALRSHLARGRLERTTYEALRLSRDGRSAHAGAGARARHRPPGRAPRYAGPPRAAVGSGRQQTLERTFGLAEHHAEPLTTGPTLGDPGGLIARYVLTAHPGPQHRRRRHLRHAVARRRQLLPGRVVQGRRPHAARRGGRTADQRRHDRGQRHRGGGERTADCRVASTSPLRSTRPRSRWAPCPSSPPGGCRRCARIGCRQTM